MPIAYLAVCRRWAFLCLIVAPTTTRGIPPASSDTALTAGRVYALGGAW